MINVPCLSGAQSDPNGICCCYYWEWMWHWDTAQFIYFADSDKGRFSRYSNRPLCVWTQQGQGQRTENRQQWYHMACGLEEGKMCQSMISWSLRGTTAKPAPLRGNYLQEELNRKSAILKISIQNMIREENFPHWQSYEEKSCVGIHGEGKKQNDELFPGIMTCQKCRINWNLELEAVRTWFGPAQMYFRLRSATGYHYFSRKLPGRHRLS